MDLLLRKFPPTLVDKRDYLLEAGFYNFYILLAMVLAPSLILEAPKSKSQKSYCPLFKMKNKIFWIIIKLLHTYHAQILQSVQELNFQYKKTHRCFKMLSFSWSIMHELQVYLSQLNCIYQYNEQVGTYLSWTYNFLIKTISTLLKLWIVFTDTFY